MGKRFKRKIIMSNTKVDYKSAGVDIAVGNESVNRIKKIVKSTFSPNVLTDIGSFGAMYDLKAIMNDYHHPVLVQSMDGVGTKTMIARMMNRYDTIGMDLVSATANDIIVLGAKPLTLLDYIANDHMQADVIEQIIEGMACACRENEISLVGGELAEMPGTYLPGEHDLVGIVTGVVEKEKVILGRDIVPGDVVLAFASSGLHTNGYSLARKLLFEVGHLSVDAYLPDSQHTVGEILLTPHLNYTRPVLAMLRQGINIKGMAHITGGGLLENIPRVLPSDCAVEIKKNAWPEQVIFSRLRKLGQLDESEMYKTFNMGVGLVMIGAASIAAEIQGVLRDFPEFKVYEIGQVIPGTQKVILI